MKACLNSLCARLAGVLAVVFTCGIIAAGSSLVAGAAGFEDENISTSDGAVVRYETDDGVAYAFTNVSAATVSVTIRRMRKLTRYLVVGGGGAGGCVIGGGGGGGGVRFADDVGSVLSPGVKFSLVVGAGGATTSGQGGRGGDSTLTLHDGTSVVALGSGGGRCYNGAEDKNTGASSGGAVQGRGAPFAVTPTDPVQGNIGGSSSHVAAGGGGYSEAGGPSVMGKRDVEGTMRDYWTGGKGGDGYSSDITGTTHCYGSGGGGACGWGHNGEIYSLPGPGGLESGGRGGRSALNLEEWPDLSGERGKDGLGGGGGGGGNNGHLSVNKAPGRGGCGTVILRLVALGPDDRAFAVDPIPDQPATGSAINPPVIVRDAVSGALLTEGTHYTVAIVNNVAPGYAYVTVTGKTGTAYAGVIGQASFLIVHPRRDRTRDIFLLLGGRNMSGRGAVDACNAMPTNGVEKFTSAKVWTAAAEPIHFDSSAAGGPGASFGAIMAAAEEGAKIGLVPCAVGGSLVSAWRPGAAQYLTTLERARAALADGGAIRAILWCQGVADATGGTASETYLADVKSLADGLRSDLGIAESIPFIAATLPESLGSDGYVIGNGYRIREFNRTIRRLAETVPNCVVAEAKDLMPNADRTTFNGDSVRELGERMACAFFEYERAFAGARLTVGAVERQALSGSDVIAPKVAVTDASTGAVVPAAAYDVAYRGVTSAGYGVAVVSGKAGSAYAGVTNFAPFRIVRPYFAAPDGTTAAAGTSWATATTFEDALSRAGATNEVWLKAGTYARTASVTMTTQCRVRGGYRGVAGELAETPLSVMDGGNTAASIINFPLKSFEADNRYHTFFDRVGFTRVIGSCVSRQGRGRLAFRRCRFFDVTKNSGGQHAINLSGTHGSAELIVRECEFRNLTDRNATWLSAGLCIGTDNAAWALIEDSLFVSNGVPWNFAVPANTLYGCGSGLAISGSAPYDFRNCVFRANRATACANMNSSILQLTGNGRTNTVVGCLFVGNEFIGRGKGNDYWKSSTAGDGMICVQNGAKVLLDSTTVAYNLSDSTGSPAGVLVGNGYAHIRNSILFGNLVNSDCKVAADLYLGANGSAFLDHALLTEDSDTSYRSAESTHLTKTGCVFGDPSFVTPLTSVTNLVRTNKKGSPTSSATHIQADFYFDQAQQDAVTAFDVHLRSSAGTCLNDGTWSNFTGEVSSALDQGDPDSPYANEPKPNGNRVNLGAYGNTAVAAKTPEVNPVITGDVGIDFPDGHTQPKFTVRCDDAEGGAYSGTVTVYTGIGDVFTATNVYTAVGPGMTLSGFVCDCYPPGSLVTVKVVLEAGGKIVEKSATKTAEGTLHPSYGKGGGATVVHVRPGATGRGDGSDWFHAYDCPLHDALKYIDSTRTNLWFAGATNYLESTPPTWSPSRASVLVGGFAGTENAPAARTKGSVTVIDGHGTYQPMAVSTTSAVTFDGFAFENGPYRGFSKELEGDLTLIGCRIVGNSQTSDGSIAGRGGYFKGTHLNEPTSRSATLTLVDCLFADNYARDLYDNNTVSSGTGGAYIWNWKHVVMDGCVFTNNCLRFDFNITSSGCNDQRGAAFWAKNAPVTASNCRFCFNHGATGNSGDFGGIVALAGGTGGSAFTNCLFMGNIETWHMGQKFGSGSGALRIETGDTEHPVDVQNCTVFANLSDGGACSAGVNVRSGAVKIRNSIIFANTVGYCRYADAADDLLVQTNAVADVAYSLLTSRTSVTNRLGGTVTFGPGVQFGDAQLVTAYAEVTNAIENTSGSQGTTTWFKKSERPSVLAFNAHLRGRRGYVDEKTGELVTAYRGRSPAIDAGDPDRESCRNEAKPNGRRVNLGFYGNTPWATMSPEGGCTIIIR